MYTAEPNSSIHVIKFSLGTLFVHTYIIIIIIPSHTKVHVCMYHVSHRALSDFDGDYAPEIGTEDPADRVGERLPEIQLP